MAYTFAALAGEYGALWRAMTIDAAREAEFAATAERMQAGLTSYRAVEAATRVPVAVIAVIHERESSLSFTAHLHNGDPLSARTVHAPAGRPPPPAEPPFAWVASAIDALRYDHLDAVSDWSVEQAAFVLEGYNGFGYRNRGLRSPYLWGGTNQQQPGKYVADGKFDPAAVDRQPGCMPLLAKLFALDPSLTLPLAGAAAPAQPVPPAGPFTAPPKPPPVPSTPSPALQGLVAALVAALVGGIAAFGHAALAWLGHLFGG
jgi:lysozyme family protein